MTKKNSEDLQNDVPTEEIVRETVNRSEETKKKLSCRLNRVIGQLNGISKMVDKGYQAMDILIQVAAVRAAVNGFSKEIISDHVKSRILGKLDESDIAIVDEIVDTMYKYTK